MNKNLTATLLSLSLILLAQGCVNISTLQTAQTLEQGELRSTIGGGLYASPDVDEAVGELVDEDVAILLPAIEFGVRYGVIEDLDLGLKLTIPGTIALDGKYRLLNKEGFAVAAGLSLGYLQVSSGSGANEVTSTLLDVMVPVYASYDVGKYFSVYVSPKYLLRAGFAEGSSNLFHFAGGTGGIKLGESFGLFLESSYMVGINSLDLRQFNGALFFSF
jgi:hypothetical protein